MIVGILQIELFIPESGTLKTKRFAIKSIKDRVRSKFNVSIAEVDHTDKWQRSTAAVSNENKHIDSIMGNIMKVVYSEHRVEVIDTHLNLI